MLRSFGTRLYKGAVDLAIEQARSALSERGAIDTLVDLGCGSGVVTARIAAGITIGRIVGVEFDPHNCGLFRERGFEAVEANLESRLPLADEMADVVITTQVIEHLADTDGFLREIKRILAPNGLAVVATENLASWHNVVALTFGFQPFSSINYSDTVYPLGNPASIHAGETSPITNVGMLHRRIFTTRALRELLQAHGFDVCRIVGSGYYPLPASLGRINPSHAHFITAIARNPAR